MKILHLLYSGLGGHGNVFFSMVSSDVAKEFQFEALFCGVEDIRKEYEERCEQQQIPFHFIKKQPGAHFSFYKKIAKAINISDPDIIFLHGSVNLPAAMAANFLSRKKRKIIVRETQALHLKTRVEKIALKLALKFANNIVFLSEEYKSDIQSAESALYKPAKIRVIPNGIDLGVFKPASFRAEDGLVTLGMQSRLVAIKDHLTLFGSLKLLTQQHPDIPFRLKIAGDGDFRTKLEEHVVSLQLQHLVTFTGMLNEADLPLFLQSLDIYIHASLGETMSTAIMQAMACGLPVIASDVDGINNMISNQETGILVPVKQPQQLADAIFSLANDANEKNKLAHNAREHAIRYFSNQRMFADYKTLFIK